MPSATIHQKYCLFCSNKTLQLASEQAAQKLREYFNRLVMLRIMKSEVCDWAIGVIERLLVQIHEPITESHKRAEL
ncbi:MAG: hypothetical protein ACQEXX_27045 [Bacillota bacterium]